MGNLYDLQMKDIEGNTVDFNIFKGKKLLVVNTASKCGYTPQYSELEKLHEEYGNRITVLGFPANNFLWQEPGSDQEIAAFCQKNYGVTFKMFCKVSVKGKDQHPLYQWLQGKTGKTPSWNFCKYLVNEDGNEVKFYSSDMHPLDPQILSEISK
ncbi:glutathione peroxidase [Chryseolinea sp. H1M3-3]|uniref:glutathione peroxidase n=1 Tax=Chryseolinea sp. H1M3-3 TaxID=3034144 RepID=UPI0023ED0BA8|nr:glutathione peroxidase [Chryseolinea sp. H1M3-3]